MTDDQQATIRRLRTEGLSCVKIAKQIGVSETTVWKFLNPKPKPVAVENLSQPLSQKQPQPKSTLPFLCNRHIACPIRKSPPLNPLPITRTEMYAMLEEAVRNTARLSR